MAGKSCGNMKRDYSNATACFENGFLYNVFPRNHSISLYDDRDVAYNAKILVSDGKRYNLWEKDDIFSIPIPRFSDSQETTFSLDYILRMIASSFRNNHENYLSICLLLQATKLMPHSNIFWKEEDYFRIVEWMYKDGQISDGDALRKYIKTDKLIQSKTQMPAISRTADGCNYYEQGAELRQKRLSDYNLYLDRLREYHLCCLKIPHLMPKSYTAYCRSKWENAESFQKIVAAAKREGISIKSGI